MMGHCAGKEGFHQRGVVPRCPGLMRRGKKGDRRDDRPLG